MIVAEGHVPGLAGKDQYNACQFKTDIGVRKCGDQCQDDSRHERENRNALQDIEYWNHHDTCSPVGGRDMSIDQGKNEREDVTQDHTQQRIASIERQHLGIQINRDAGGQRSCPTLGGYDEKGYSSKYAQRNQEINATQTTCRL